MLGRCLDHILDAFDLILLLWSLAIANLSCNLNLSPQQAILKFITTVATKIKIVLSYY